MKEVDRDIWHWRCPPLLYRYTLEDKTVRYFNICFTPLTWRFSNSNRILQSCHAQDILDQVPIDQFPHLPNIFAIRKAFYGLPIFLDRSWNHRQFDIISEHQPWNKVCSRLRPAKQPPHPVFEPSHQINEPRPSYQWATPLVSHHIQVMSHTRKWAVSLHEWAQTTNHWATLFHQWAPILPEGARSSV